MVCLSMGWRRQEKCHAKSFGVALFAGTRHPATACVDKKSGTPSNVHARLLPSCCTTFRPAASAARPGLASLRTESFPAGAGVSGAAKCQKSLLRRTCRNCWKCGKGVTRFFSSVASFFQHCQLFPALPPFPDLATWDGFPNPSCRRVASRLPIIATGCQTFPDVVGSPDSGPGDMTVPQG